MTPPAIERVKASLAHKPWTVDVLSGGVSFVWGCVVLADPQTMNRAAWDFLDPLPAWFVGLVGIVLGAAQLAAAFLGIVWARRALGSLQAGMAMCAAIGIKQSDPHTTTWVQVGGYAVANVVIALRGI